jgi:hypothetical protein
MCVCIYIYIYKLIFIKYIGIPRNEQTFFLYNLACLLEEGYHFPFLHIDESTAHIALSVSFFKYTLLLKGNPFVFLRVRELVAVEYTYKTIFFVG